MNLKARPFRIQAHNLGKAAESFSDAGDACGFSENRASARWPQQGLRERVNEGMNEQMGVGWAEVLSHRC